MRDALDVALGRRRQLRERLPLPQRRSMPARRIRHGDDAAPRRRKRQPREQRRDVVAIAAPAALEHQAAAGERPRADGRTLRAARRARQRRRVGRRCRAARRAPARPPARAACPSRARRAPAARDATRIRAPRVQPVMREKPARELGRALGVLALDLERVGAAPPTPAASAPAPPRRCRRTSGPSEPRRSSTPKCRRAGASTNTASLDRAASCGDPALRRAIRGGRRADVVGQQRHRLELVRARRSCPRSPAAAPSRSR